MIPTSAERLRADSRLIGQTLRKLSAPKILLRVMVVVVAAGLWLWTSSAILDFGHRLDYSAFSTLGQQAVDIMGAIGPYLWWIVVLLWSLIVFFSIRSWINRHIEASRAAPINLAIFNHVAARISIEAREVLKWSWSNRDEPFTEGDLRRARDELIHGRVDKLAIVRAQLAILQAEGLADTPPYEADTRPVASAIPTGTSRAAGHPRRGPIEPRLGRFDD